MTSRSIIRLAAIASAALLAVVVTALAAAPGASPSSPNSAASSSSGHDMRNLQHRLESILSGRENFRFETFGDEALWGEKLRLRRAIAGPANGGVGRGLSPKKALAVGLKVDVAALPQRHSARMANPPRR